MNNSNVTRIYDGFVKVDLVQTPQGSREVVRATDSVSILLYNPDEGYLLLVQQPRAPMISADNPHGILIETVAGRFDIDLGVKALAVKEAAEEVGAIINEDDVTLLNSGHPLALSPGVLTEKAYLAMARIDIPFGEATDHVFGAEGEGEEIKRIFLRFDAVFDFINSGRCQDLRVYTLLLALSLTESFQK